MKESPSKSTSATWSYLPESLACDLSKIAVPKTFKKGSTLYHMGDAPKGLFFIYEGLVGLFNTSKEGKEHLFRIFGKGSCLGHRSLAAEEPYHASSKVLETSQIGSIGLDQAKKLLDQSPEFARHLLKKMAKELRVAELRLAASTDRQVAERVAESMIYLKESFPEHRWTRNEIAYFCGSTGPTVIRTLSQLEELGLIQQKGREIAILDKEGLKEFANL